MFMYIPMVCMGGGGVVGREKGCSQISVLSIHYWLAVVVGGNCNVAEGGIVFLTHTIGFNEPQTDRCGSNSITEIFTHSFTFLFTFFLIYILPSDLKHGLTSVGWSFFFLQPLFMTILTTSGCNYYCYKIQDFEWILNKVIRSEATHG